MFIDRISARLDPPRFDDLDDPERGDVPGWVLITLMTAGLPVVMEIA